MAKASAINGPMLFLASLDARKEPATGMDDIDFLGELRRSATGVTFVGQKVRREMSPLILYAGRKMKTPQFPMRFLTNAYV